MKKSLIWLAAMAAVTAAPASPVTRRARTHDVSFGYRMGAGFAGDVNRTHPASIVPGIQDPTVPVKKYGEGAIIDTTSNGYRGIKASDQSDSTPINIQGISVRPYPIQSAVAAGNYGAQGLSDPVSMPSTGPQDYLRAGFMMVKVRGTGAVSHNGIVYGFCTADETGHVQGGFEVAAIASKTVPIANARFRGPADANGIAEIEIWAAT